MLFNRVNFRCTQLATKAVWRCNRSRGANNRTHASQQIASCSITSLAVNNE
jgi:hypothetical protein